MKVKVSNIAFPKNQYLVDYLLKEFPDAVINTEAMRMNSDVLVSFFRMQTWHCRIRADYFFFVGYAAGIKNDCQIMVLD